MNNTPSLSLSLPPSLCANTIVYILIKRYLSNGNDHHVILAAFQLIVTIFDMSQIVAVERVLSNQHKQIIPLQSMQCGDINGIAGRRAKANHRYVYSFNICIYYKYIYIYWPHLPPLMNVTLIRSSQIQSFRITTTTI